MAEQELQQATIVSLQQESPTIKRLTLRVDKTAVDFKAGQWVDFHIPGLTIFTGFSMCSPPHLLHSSGLLELAVKVSDYEPTLWVHEKCQVGDTVNISVGGDFFYDPEPHQNRGDVLLLAAGVGINPIVSVLAHISHLNCGKPAATGRTVLLYSAQTSQELVFRNEIAKMCADDDKLEARFFITREESAQTQKCINRRISREDVRNALTGLDVTKTQTFICGPPEFIDDMLSHSKDAGLMPEHVHYEKWWKKH